ncbi:MULTISPECIES: hypothetical protein [Pseudomonas]|uniref:hypothetical protein n=1 Tax=Pseudomonas TaxID=286 RepID=UPI000F847A1A|nr:MULTISPECIES: hypothetical protein [Pseudomonas]RTY62916.1 hypothetical protein EKA83_33680 [Pseudomonas veronii]
MDSDTPDTPVAAPAPKAQAAPSPYKLIVKFAFADYQVGQEISDAAEVAAVLAGDCDGKVLKVANA